MKHVERLEWGEFSIAVQEEVSSEIYHFGKIHYHRADGRVLPYQSIVIIEATAFFRMVVDSVHGLMVAVLVVFQPSAFRWTSLSNTVF